MTTVSVTAASVSASQAIALSERQSAAAATASASVPSSSRWIFTEERLMNVPSIREGMSPEEELKRRRVAANTIHQMADKLNQESRVRISQLCICAAMMHMHRFFVFHSFFKFDPRDIAAACLFLAGKSEECPRKLDNVVRVWWSIKFPHTPNIENSRMHDASQLIVTLENLVLQTIAFDLSVDIPHPYVLTHMQRFARDAAGNRRISEIAYWFASDMLHMTNWGVRYTARTIACVCMQMACLWADFKIKTVTDGLYWFQEVDPTMTLDTLLKLTEEFSTIYKMHGESLNIKKYAMRSSLRETPAPQSPNQPQQPPRPGQNQGQTSIATLPPPPVAPQLNSSAGFKPNEPTRRIDLNDYKLRNSATQQQNQSNSSQNPVMQAQRRNFMRPDVPPQTATKGLDLPLPPIIANEKQQNQHKMEQGTVKLNEHVKLSQLPKSGIPKLASSQKPLPNITKPPQVNKLPALANEQERHKRSRPDDFERDAKYRRVDKMPPEGSHHRRRPLENNTSLGQSDSVPATNMPSLLSVTQMSKSGTPKPTERHNPSSFPGHNASSSNSAPRIRDELSSQSLKRDSSGNRMREENPPRQRDDTVTPKSLRQLAPLNALLPTPSTSTCPAVNSGSQNSKYSSVAVQPNRSTNYTAENSYRPNAGNWSVTNDHHIGQNNSNSVRFSQPSGSSNHRHYSSSNMGRVKGREPLLNTPEAANSYYKRSRQRPASPSASTTSLNSYRQSQRPPSPGNRSSGPNYPRLSRHFYYCGRHYIYRSPSASSTAAAACYSSQQQWRNSPSNSARVLTTLPPPPLPPQNEELEDGEVL